MTKTHMHTRRNVMNPRLEEIVEAITVNAEFEKSICRGQGKRRSF